jgi:hypothetical protein
MPRNFCQNPLCHLHDTDDRLKNGKYQTRKAKKDWYNFFCTRECFIQFFSIHSNSIINFIGLKTEPSFRDQDDDNYWYRSRAIQNRPNYNYSKWQEIPRIVNQELNQN